MKKLGQKILNAFGLYTREQVIDEVETAYELAAEYVVTNWNVLQYWGMYSVKDRLLLIYKAFKRKGK